MQNQNNITEKTAAMAVIGKINEVSDFDPTPLAVEFEDENTKEKRKRLPVMVQMAWFRMKYPEGKITVQVTPANNCFVAKARVYPSYKDTAEAYLAEATASRGVSTECPNVSPLEWAQTAAVGIALRNAGFGLQFAVAGDEPEGMNGDGVGMTDMTDNSTMGAPIAETDGNNANTQGEPEEYTVVEPVQKEMTMEDALKQPCPISKYKGMTLGEVLAKDPKAINWVATKYSNEDDIKKAAIMLCEYAAEQATSA